MQRMIFISGFARGGTSWLRDCIKAHPKVQELPRERTIFRDLDNPDEIRAYLEAAVAEEGLDPTSPIVNKAPANAPYLFEAASAFPDFRFLFIVRDPRDVLVSHQRGTKAWMGGSNSTAKGCMAKSQKYYSGWEKARDLPNTYLVRYEDIHQNFFSTMSKIFAFLGLATSSEDLSSIYAAADFRKQTARKNREDRDSGRRKGVIGDWAVHLSEKDQKWYRQDEYWSEFMRRYGYDWKPLNYDGILDAMCAAGCTFLSEGDLLDRRLDSESVNVALMHDIDDLNSTFARASIVDTAKSERQRNLPAIYNFLPVDDRRYRKVTPKDIQELLEEICEINPSASIALHLNASEKFFPANMADQGNQQADLTSALAYLDEQVAVYDQLGFKIRTATAHGYGRGKKKPNNRDTPEFSDRLGQHGIQLFDTVIRPDIQTAASHFSSITDVGGIIQPRGMMGGVSILDSACYSTMPGGTFIRFLNHPGNYESKKPAVLAMRHFRSAKATSIGA